MTAVAGMHVFMTADAVGGVWTYALDLARGMAAHGVRTTLVVQGPVPTADQIAAAHAVPLLRLLPTALPLDWLAVSVSELAEAAVVLAALAAQSGADLVHLNLPAPAAFARFPAPVIIACHSCVATWWEAVRGGAMPDDFRWRSAITRKGYAAADLLIAPSAAFAAATARAYDLPSPPLVIHNGRLAAGAGAARHTAAPFALAAGRLWDAGKGMATLDLAAAQVSLRIIAAGETQGPDGSGIRFRHLHPVGRLPEASLRRLLALRPIFVAPARYEPFGIAVLEAAQAGCALLLADTPVFRELWNGAAAFFPAGDADALADALRATAADGERRAALGVAAQKWAGRYTLDRQIAAMLDAYRTVLPHARPGGVKEVAA
jgi:glycosyltransferase involved in cell wall biosynthesis